MDVVGLGLAKADAKRKYAPVASIRHDFVPVCGRARPQHAVTGAVLSDGSLQGTTFRVVLPVLVTAHGLRFRYSNIYNLTGAETDGPNDIIVSASVELSGVMYPITWRGQTSVTIKPGAYIDSDAMGFDVAKGSTLPVRTYVSVGTLGQKWPLGFTAVTANGEGSNRANTDLTPPGSGGVPQVADRMYGPSAVLGHIASPTATVGICGDSIAAGFTTVAEQGFIEKALTGTYPFQSVAYPSDNASRWGTHAVRRRRIPFLDGSTHIICEQGANSLSGGLATLQGQLLLVWSLFAARGALVYQTTITPSTSSTDAWATTANQTVGANEATRVGCNDWIRAGAPVDPTTKAIVAIGTLGALTAGKSGHPLTGYFEIADLAETARNSGKWKSVGSGVSAAYTADGLHPTQVGHDALAPGIAPASTFGLPTAL